MQPFVHLRVHTAYSLSEGAIRPEALAAFCKKHRMPAIGVADRNNLFGALEWSKLAKDSGIQPIIGVTLNVLLPQGPGMSAATRRHAQLPLFAQNEEGHRHLLALVSESFLSAPADPAPCIELGMLLHRAEGIIALTGGAEGLVARLLLEGRELEAEETLLELARLFKDRLYVEIQRHGLAEERATEPKLRELASRHGLPIVATNLCYFDDESMYEAHDALLCIAEGRYLVETDRRKSNPNFRLKTADEMATLFADMPEALANSARIAKRCGYASPSRAPILPRFMEYQEKPEGAPEVTEEEEFRRVSREGLEWRLNTYVFTQDMSEEDKKRIGDKYRERLEFELSTIEKMRFPGYFLIVSEFIRWAKEHDIPVGPGRGSGAGSLVAWAMQITDLDPIRYGLLFERFLNPERVSMPDFDVDFCQDRRDEVITHVQQKYGRDRVAQIITFGKLQARAVLRDVGRVLQLPYGQVDRICKLVPNNPANPVTLQEAIDMEPLLRAAMSEDGQVAHMVAIALKLEGLYRHASTHAAGVVIGDRPLHELVPMYRDPRSDMPVVQFSMKYAEMAGLVKFDFLGLKTLTVLQWAVRLVKETEGLELDLLKLPEGDKTTYSMLGQGESVGVFQLESAGMRDTLRKLKADCLEDIIALVSLYRPGPMDNIPTYVNRKHGKEKPDYLYPMLEPCLKETFGVFIYQEQVMEVARVMGGYSLGQADLLRRAMGKKIKAEMDAQKDTFVKGALEKSVPQEKAEEVFDLMAKFASYGFNKSHAAAYALIAYQTAYLKANYPVQFFTALMALDAGNTDKLQIFRQDAARMGITLLPPDINASRGNFSVEPYKGEGKKPHRYAIRYALGAIKNVGMAAMEKLVEERERGGPFKDIYDFLSRLDDETLNRRSLEFLIKAGAFDALHPSRRQLAESLDALLAWHSHQVEEKTSQQQSLFGGSAEIAASSKPALQNVPEWGNTEKLSYEFTAIGFYLSSHPLESYGPACHQMGVVFSGRFGELLNSSYQSVQLAGIVLSRKVKLSSKGKFAFIGITDPQGSFEVSVFDEDILNKYWNNLEEGSRLWIQAEGKMDENGPRLIAKAIRPLDEVITEQQKSGRGGRMMQWRMDISSRLRASELKAMLPEAKPARKGNLTVKMMLKDGTGLTFRLPGQYGFSPADMENLQTSADILSLESL
jgi:DNA polymerase-3 subunit alpha